MKTIILVATAFHLLLVASGVSSEGPTIRSRNGIRLVGDSGPRGRLEVSTQDPKFPGLNNSGVAWLPVCDTACTNQLAGTMCKLLGYSYGRKYYAPRVNVRSSTSGYTSGSFSCSQKSPPGSRRLLASSRAEGGTAASSGIALAALGAAAESGDVADTGAGRDTAWRHDRHGGTREAMSVMRYNVSTSASAPYTCAFYLGSCESRGPLAAIECSNEALPPSHPPPPAPPAPPGVPLSYMETIRLWGGASNRGTAEPNLCSPSSPEFCIKYGRVELLVTIPNGIRLWAPLCAPSNHTWREEVARIACQQEYDWPSLRRTSLTVTSVVPDGPPYSFAIPTGPSTARGEFNPARIWVWATIEPAATASNPRTLQDFGIRLSPQPCKTGCMLALACNFNTIK